MLSKYKAHNMLIKKQSYLTNLRQASEQAINNPPFYGNVLGILVDQTRPLYRPRTLDYIVEIKIIDDTINSSSVFGIQIKSCSIYLFSKDPSQLQLSNKIGQLILLHQFTFNIWHGVRLETKYQASVQHLTVLEVVKQKLKAVGRLISSGPRPDLQNPQLIQKALQLKTWFQGYFTIHSPHLGISLITNSTVMAEPFNMILRRKDYLISDSYEMKDENDGDDRQEGEAHEIHNDDSSPIVLEDYHGNRFFVARKVLLKRKYKTKYVFIRGIKCIGNFYEILLTITGCVLGLPDTLENIYQEKMNYCALYRFGEKFLLKDHKACQLSRVSFIPPKSSAVIDLLKNTQLYQSKSSSENGYRIEDIYMIEVAVINFRGKLQLFHTDYQLIVHEQYISSLPIEEKKEMMENGKLAYLYEGVLGVMDRSSESTGKLLYVHLFSNETRTAFYEPNMIQKLNKIAGSPASKQLEAITQEKIEQKLAKLMETDFSNTVTLLVEPIKSEILIYRLTNTIFP